MLLDLLSQSNYANYNISIANLLGLQLAVYLNVLLDINSKAIKKKKTENSFFSLDREYIKKVTTLSVDEQKDCDKKLIQLGILEVESSTKTSTIKLNVSNITALLLSEDESLISTVTKIVKGKASARTKKERDIDFLKTFISTSNPELRDAYSDWIESVMAKQNWMSKRSVVVGQEVIDSVSNRNLDVALTIINIAAINGYRDMNWAVERYKENYKVDYKTDLTRENIQAASSSPLKFTSEVF